MQPAPNLPEHGVAHATGFMDHTPLTDSLRFDHNILSYDADWQYPAITERYAYQLIRRQSAVPDTVTYVAYPWATLLDKLQRGTEDLEPFLARFRQFCARVPAETRKVTVCQHIKMKDALAVLRMAGIDDVFWSHATHDDLSAARREDRTRSPVLGPRIHPFPLFPVQAMQEADVDPVDTDRPYLFSFMGAQASPDYLTQSRTWILEHLCDDPRGAITGRASWHYNKIVYDHQIHQTGQPPLPADGLIDHSASSAFRDVLRASVFSLCPSGTGPNSIRLWESLGLGAVPVILSDDWAPPGDPALWRGGAVFCPETPEAIQALPERLARLAAEPGTLARLRHGARQLWALYGPDGFISDLQETLLDTAPPSQAPAPELLTGVMSDLMDQDRASPASATLYLNSLSSRLLTPETRAAALAETCSEQVLAATRRACDILGATHPLVRHLERVETFTRPRADISALRPALAAPAVIARGPIHVCLAGRHANRTPLAYAPFQALTAGRIRLTQTLADADIALTGFSADLPDLRADLQAAQAKRPHLQTVVMSEEPLWDSIWNTQLVERHQRLETAEGRLEYHVFNHSNSDIFAFDEIPYFVLTRTAFAVRYALGLARYRKTTPAMLLRQWHQAPIPAAFYAEVRDTEAYRKTWPAHHVAGLSVYRTEIARSTALPGTLREGRGWRPEAKRQALADWHLDKMAALDGRCRIVSAYENTHQHAYISEKLFDAFLLGGIPTYYADPDHRVHALVPEAAMINTYGLSPDAAAQKIAQFYPDLITAEAWLETAQALQRRFSDPKRISAERQRIAQAATDALESCLP